MRRFSGASFTQLMLLVLSTLLVAAYLLANLLVLARQVDLPRTVHAAFHLDHFSPPPAPAISDRRLGLFPMRFSVVGALLVGLIYAADWDGYLRFAFAQDFGEPDPVFGHDLGFYVFVLPFVKSCRTPAPGISRNGRSRRRLCPGGKPTVYAGTGDRGPACGYEAISSRTRSCSFWRGRRATSSIATIS